MSEIMCHMPVQVSETAYRLIKRQYFDTVATRIDKKNGTFHIKIMLSWDMPQVKDIIRKHPLQKTENNV